MTDSDEEELSEKQFKICLIGDSQVGKTSIVSRYATDKLGKFPATVGVDFYLKRTTLPGPRHITLKVLFSKLSIHLIFKRSKFRMVLSLYLGT